MTNEFQAEWARIDSPTRRMTQADAAAYFKAHAVAGDCRFSLREDSTIPEPLRACWLALLAKVEDAPKETAVDRAEASRLRAVWRRLTDLRLFGRTDEAETLLANLQPVTASSARASTNWKARALAAEAKLAQLERRAA